MKAHRTAWRIAQGKPTMLTTSRSTIPVARAVAPSRVFQRGSSARYAPRGPTGEPASSRRTASATAASIATYAINVTTNPMSAPRGRTTRTPPPPNSATVGIQSSPACAAVPSAARGTKTNPTAVRRTMLRQWIARAARSTCPIARGARTRCRSTGDQRVRRVAPAIITPMIRSVRLAVSGESSMSA